MPRPHTSIDEAMGFDFDAFGWGDPANSNPEHMGRDHDFESDFRNMLISFQDPNFDLRDFLADCESDRYLELRWAHKALEALVAPHPTLPNYFPGREKLTKLAMADSLCPIHFIDWAICFDDEDPSCAQVRAIFPNCHDT